MSTTKTQSTFDLFAGLEESLSDEEKAQRAKEAEEKAQREAKRAAQRQYEEVNRRLEETHAMLRRRDGLEPEPAKAHALAPVPANDTTTTTRKPTNEWKLRRGGWDAPVPPISWLVEDLLAVGKVIMLYAEPGTMKSWIALSIAIAVATGKPWLGERPVRSGPVLYIDFEDGEHEFSRRVQHLAGSDTCDDLIWVYSPGRGDDEEFWKQVAAIVKAEGVSLVVVDTLAGATRGVDENSTEAAEALQLAGNVTEATGVTVLFLHHANKSGDIRGTSAFKANVDSLLKLEKQSADSDDLHQIFASKLTCEKSGQKKTRPIVLQLSDEHGLRRLDAPAKAPAQAHERAPDQTTIRKDARSLAEVQADILLQLRQHGPVRSKKKIRELAACGTDQCNACLEELLLAGDVLQTDEGYRVATDADEKRSHERTIEVVTADVLALIGARGPFASRDAIKLALGQGDALPTIDAALAELEQRGAIRKFVDGYHVDSEEERRKRLRTAIRANPSGGKPKILSEANVRSEDFERIKAAGHIHARSSSSDISGFVWYEEH